MRQLLKEDMIKNNWNCNCIRCREIKNNNINHDNTVFEIITYNASGGLEYFISLINDKYLIGFIRLRISLNSDYSKILDILHDCALIRELHVYSNISIVGSSNMDSCQHKGYGKKLLEKAEEIALEHKFKKIAVISGTGVRNYYRKFNYELIDTFMIKNL
jgi:elongator complex protein 3